MTRPSPPLPPVAIPPSTYEPEGQVVTTPQENDTRPSTPLGCQHNGPQYVNDRTGKVRCELCGATGTIPNSPVWSGPQTVAHCTHAGTPPMPPIDRAALTAELRRQGKAFADLADWLDA